MHIVFRQTCRVCGSPHLVPVVDLGAQYLQGAFLKDGHPTAPLRKIPTQLVRCDVTRNEKGCGLLQLAHTLPSEILYANYWYRSGTNATMREHLKEIVDSAVGFMPSGNRRVLDIGCNDGTLLNFYPQTYERYGCDPSDIAREIPPPITVINTAFPSIAVTEAAGTRKFDLITSIAMYYDLEDPVGFAVAIRNLLADDGVWIVEMSYLPMMLAQNSFDTICHEHLEYYSLAVIEEIARRAGLQVFRADLNEINGGSIRLYLSRAGNSLYGSETDRDFLRSLRLREFELELDTDVPYLAFQERIEGLRADLSKLLKDAVAAGRKVHVYGASTKGNVLLQWYGLDKNLIECAADRNPHKHGARTLGTDIPIVSEEESRALHPDYYLVLPWHFKAEFLERERGTIQNGTKMIFPLPEVLVVATENLDQEIARARSTSHLAF